MKLGTKKAMSQVTALTAIIVVLFAVVLFGIVLKAEASTKNKDRQICQASVSAQAVAMSVSKNIIQPSCKTYNVVFYDDRVEINGERQSVYDLRTHLVSTKFEGLTNDIVNQVLAEELRWCWYQYLEGKKYVINRRNLVSFWLDKPTLCVLCDEVSFDNNVIQSEFTGFYEYTKTHKMSSSSQTYYSYYAEGNPICSEYTDAPINCWESYFENRITSKTPSLTPQNTVFNKKEKYALVFIMDGLKKGAFKIEGDVNFFSYVLPFNQLATQCDSLQRGSVE